MANKFTSTRDFTMQVGSLTAAAGLAVDTTPNTTEPNAARISTTPRTSDSSFIAMGLVSDAALTVEGWMWSDKIGRWVRLFSQVLVADIVSVVSNLPSNVPFTLIVTVNAGTTAKVVAGMFY